MHKCPTWLHCSVFHCCTLQPLISTGPVSKLIVPIGDMNSRKMESRLKNTDFNPFSPNFCACRFPFLHRRRLNSSTVGTTSFVALLSLFGENTLPYRRCLRLILFSINICKKHSEDLHQDFTVTFLLLCHESSRDVNVGFKLSTKREWLQLNLFV